jgi:transglutaminase-like putative cysteine protease
VSDAILQAFDPLELDGEDLRPLPLGKRKDRLARLLARVRSGIAVNQHTDEDGAVVFLYACRMGLEGWIYAHLEYQPGSSNEETTADETLLKRAGICRDFSHLGIAFCRGLGIPARFVSCYAHGLVPSDFHAVFEAYLDGRWWLFDATRQADLDGLVRIGIGRDAAEVAFSTPIRSVIAGASPR